MSIVDPVPASKLTCDHGLRRQTIVASLLADVFHGRLRAGQHLVTRELAGRFGVSHTPIREALIAMAGTGFIDLLPNRGAVVRRVTARDVHEVCQVRRVLECEAVRRACGRMDRVELQSLDAGLKRQLAEGESASVAEARSLDSRLHDGVAAACGNGFLAQELERLKTLFRALRDVSWEHDAVKNVNLRLAEESSEHLAIVEALAAGDGRSASRAMSRHILGGAAYWSQVVCAPKADGLGARPRAARPVRGERTR